jgi:heme-degrading monooxygenase HmoA
MIERHVALDLVEGNQDSFERFLRERYFPAMSAQPGFISVSVLRELEVPNRYTLVIRFTDSASAASWRENAAHKDLSPIFKSFYSQSSLTVYEVILITPEYPYSPVYN